jgi:hypothetical protein
MDVKKSGDDQNPGGDEGHNWSKKLLKDHNEKEAKEKSIKEKNLERIKKKNRESQGKKE